MMDDDYEELMMMTGPTCFFSHAGRWNLRDAGKNCDPQNLHGTALLAARGLNMINQTVTEASESGMCAPSLGKMGGWRKRRVIRGQCFRYRFFF